MKQHSKIVALTAVLALVVPAAAVAKRPDFAGKGKPERAKGEPESAKGKGNGVKLARVNLKGEVVSVDGATVTLSVAKANAHGKACRGSELTLDLAGARVRTADHDGNGTRDVADVMAGHHVLVHAMAPRVKGRKTTCPFATGDTVAAKKLVNKTPLAETETEAEEEEVEVEVEVEQEEQE